MQISCLRGQRTISRLGCSAPAPTNPKKRRRPCQVLDRGEKLDLLVDKTELLQGEAFAFRREASRARRVMWWKVG